MAPSPASEAIEPVEDQVERELELHIVIATAESTLVTGGPGKLREVRVRHREVSSEVLGSLWVGSLGAVVEDPA